MPDFDCRLAKLEERVDNIHEVLTERRRQSDRIEETLVAINEKLTMMRGFGTGAGFVLSMIGVAVGYVIDKLWSGGHG